MLANVIILISLFHLGISKMQDYTLNLDDILDDNLMPMSLVMLEEGSDFSSPNSTVLLDKIRNKLSFVDEENQIGTFDKAFNSMGFHRQMINNFLCSKFVAEQILSDFKPFQLKNRLGITSPSLSNLTSTKFDKEKNKVNMLYDEGSNQYRNWLQK